MALRTGPHSASQQNHVPRSKASILRIHSHIPNYHTNPIYHLHQSSITSLTYVTINTNDLMGHGCYHIYIYKFSCSLGQWNWEWKINPNPTPMRILIFSSTISPIPAYQIWSYESLYHRDFQEFLSIIEFIQRIQSESFLIIPYKEI